MKVMKSTWEENQRPFFTFVAYLSTSHDLSVFMLLEFVNCVLFLFIIFFLLSTFPLFPFLFLLFSCSFLGVKGISLCLDGTQDCVGRTDRSLFSRIKKSELRKEVKKKKKKGKGKKTSIKTSHFWFPSFSSLFLPLFSTSSSLSISSVTSQYEQIEDYFSLCDSIITKFRTKRHGYFDNFPRVKVIERDGHKRVRRKNLPAFEIKEMHLYQWLLLGAILPPVPSLSSLESQMSCLFPSIT